MDTPRHRRLGWIALTLPLSLAALVVYMAFEWVFFVTKPSVLTALPWRDRLIALVETPAPFIPWIVTIQTIATLIAILAFKRLRCVAVVPAGLLLGFLGLVLADNFTHALFGFSSANIDVRLRYVYAVLLLLLVAVASRKVYEQLERGSAKRNAAAILLLALPSLAIFAAAEIRRPRIGGVFSSSASAAPHATRPNVLFLTNDGVEARHLSVYGSATRTPFLDSIRDQTLFGENAFANVCRTYGSLVTILTGKLPTHTRVLDPPSMVHDDARHEHLPGILRQHGYRTLQLTTKYHADAATANLVGAFDLANYDWELLRLTRVERATDTARLFRLQVFDRLQERLMRIFAGQDRDSFASVVKMRVPTLWRDEHRVSTLLRFIGETTEPWFAHVHLLDTHLDGGNKYVDPAPAIAAADEWMRVVFDALRKNGQLERTIIVISADHGRLWQTRERVPLMIRFPHGRHAGRVAQNVQTADIAPTTLDALGLPIPPWMDGRSLLRPVPADRPIVALCTRESLTDAAKLRVPNFGTTSATIVVGSWWYEMQLADGALRVGPVAGHTVPTPRTPPATAVGALGKELIAAGFRLPAEPRALSLLQRTP